MVLLARAMLRDPYWPLRAAAALGRTEAMAVPPQYEGEWNALGPMAKEDSIARPMRALA